MAAMFRDFSFEAASRHPERAAMMMSVSPISRVESPHLARLPTPPPCSIGDLAHALDQQNLCVFATKTDASSSLLSTGSCEPLTPPSDHVAFPACQPVRPPLLSTARLDCAILRRQRQANTRLQCSSSHIRDISALVEKMIETEDQCCACNGKLPSATPPSPSLSPLLIADEGVEMDYTPSDSIEELRSLVPLLRASESGNRTRVSKTVRMRTRKKKPVVAKKPSK